jgi:NAD+ kinase
VHDGSRIGLVLHPVRNCGMAVRQVAAWTSTHDVELVAGAEDVERLGLEGVTPVDVEELATSVDGLIALGGDGTLLGAMRLVAAKPVPVLGVNFGRLGFLTEVEARELDGALAAMAEGRSTVEPRSCLVVRGPGWEAVAFNDVVLARVPGQGQV